ncbi:MAG: response regulator transcription factor [Actinobacteria bacterium]|nr:response regulator transcription factor [Actinomycetota bacterium]
MQPNTRTAVVLDKHPLWAEAVEGVMRRVGVDIVGKATSGVEALSLVQRLRPDLLVTDIGAADGDSAGLTCLREARQHIPELRGVVLSLSEDTQQIDAALQAGAVAYVLKSAHPDDLASAVRQAFAHSVYFASPTGQWNGGLERQASASADRADLTKREREILTLVAEGSSNAQLARMLWVTEQTVKFHLSNVYRKLNVSNRTEAARWAQLHGLVPTPGAIVAAPGQIAAA